MHHDIDRLIARVRSIYPDVIIERLKVMHEADDDGLWHFRLSISPKSLQVESSTSDLPFLIEHHGMHSSSDAIHVDTLEDAVSAISSFFASVVPNTK